MSKRATTTTTTKHPNEGKFAAETTTCPTCDAKPGSWCSVLVRLALMVSRPSTARHFRVLYVGPLMLKHGQKPNCNKQCCAEYPAIYVPHGRSKSNDSDAGNGSVYPTL